MTKNKNKKYIKDHIYCNGILVNKFVNLLTDNGKKSYKYKLLLKSLSISKFKVLPKIPKLNKKGLWCEQRVHIKRFFSLDSTYLNYKESSMKGASFPNKQTVFALPESASGFQVPAPLGSHPRTSSKLIGSLHPNIGALITLASPNKVGNTTHENNYNGGIPIQKIDQCVPPTARINILQNDINKLLLFYQAVGNVKPSVETRKVRIGGAIYQVPCIIQKLRQEGIAMRWLIMSASIKKRWSFWGFSNCLSQEFLDCIKKEGQSLQKRDQIHNLAANNRAYARYRWW